MTDYLTREHGLLLLGAILCSSLWIGFKLQQIIDRLERINQRLNGMEHD